MNFWELTLQNLARNIYNLCFQAPSHCVFHSICGYKLVQISLLKNRHFGQHGAFLMKDSRFPPWKSLVYGVFVP